MRGPVRKIAFEHLFERGNLSVCGRACSGKIMARSRIAQFYGKRAYRRRRGVAAMRGSIEHPFGEHMYVELATVNIVS